MKRLLLAAVVALAFAPAAHAKGPLQVCGVSRCVLLSQEVQPPVRIVGVEPATTPLVAPPAPAPFFVINWTVHGGALAYWVPSASKLRLVGPAAGQWVAALPAEEALLRDKTAGLKPFAAPAHANAWVDWEAVRHAGRTYLRLFTLGAPVAAPPDVRWLEIWIRGAQTPWTDYDVTFWVSRTGSFLKRDDGVVLRIPRTVADRIRKRLPLDS